jgi:hypothetical protein
MTPDFEAFYQDIGHLALGVASEEAVKIMVYAEMEDGSVSADVFYQEDDPDVIHYRLSPPVLDAVLEAYWDACGREDPARAWRVLTYVIDEGAFKVELKFPEQVDENEDLAERRPAAVRAVFGEGVVDYSSPGF